MQANVKQANINIELKNLFIKWLEITNSFHHLTKQETKVLGLLLYYHYKYKHDITNSKIVWKMVFDYDTKKRIKATLDSKDSVLQNILTKFRKMNIIKDNEITSTFIPQLSLNSNNFKVIFNFNIINE